MERNSTPGSERKASFKLPPGHVIDRAQSQAARRSKALEEQKQRRAKRIESERHIDLFADLSLGASDEEAEEMQTPRRNLQPVGKLVSLLQPGPSPCAVPEESTPVAEDVDFINENNATQPSPKPKSKRRRRQKASKKQSSPWADKCMYAELLEMTDADVAQWPDQDIAEGLRDGLPEDLESGWVAIAPVPVGKRCLAVSHQGSGTIGVVPNTTLRSRVLGKPLMPRFPSPLPSDTILDCILDQNWVQNGILHVLDVLKWKGQDVADCEASFRFWWRDTRLSELPLLQPPTVASSSKETSPSEPWRADGMRPMDPSQGGRYRFPYPTTFSPISYHINTTSEHLVSHVIPLARLSHNITFSIPTNPSSALQPDSEMGIEIEEPQKASTDAPVMEITTEVKSDGLLLYVAQAIYEPGTSPLSTWVPLTALENPDSMEEHRKSPLDIFERLVLRRWKRV